MDMRHLSSRAFWPDKFQIGTLIPTEIWTKLGTTQAAVMGHKSLLRYLLTLEVGTSILVSILNPEGSFCYQELRRLNLFSFVLVSLNLIVGIHVTFLTIVALLQSMTSNRPLFPWKNI